MKKTAFSIILSLVGVACCLAQGGGNLPLTCAPDKEVQCGTAWSFDNPTAARICEVGEPTVEVAGTVTNAVVPRCPAILSITRTWRASDPCQNTGSCTQTVTIVDTEPP